MTIRYDEFISLLDGVNEKPGGIVLARCPACGAELFAKRGETAAIVARCRRRPPCSFVEILTAVELRRAEAGVAR